MPNSNTAQGVRPAMTGGPPPARDASHTPPTPTWTLSGTTGADTLTGTANADRIYGDAGNDTISALAGNDVLDGGAGTNRLTGGAGADLFVIDKATATAGAITTLTDFSVADHDHIAFKGYGRAALFTTAAAAQASGGVYQHLVTVGGASLLQLDVYAAGSTTAAATVQLVGVTATITDGLFGGPGGHGGPHP